MSRVAAVSRHELEARKAAILDGLGMTFEELSERAASVVLVGTEWEAWQALRDIEFLLGHE